VTYLDSSALLRLLVQEPESDDLAEQLDGLTDELVTSELTLAELHRNASKHGVEQGATDEVLEQVSLLAVTTDLLRRAGRLPTAGDFLRTADALHIVTAMTTGESSLCTYDRRQAEVAASFGFGVLAPGRPPGWHLAGR